MSQRSLSQYNSQALNKNSTTNCVTCTEKSIYTKGYGNIDSEIIFVLLNPSPNHPKTSDYVCCFDWEIQPSKGTGFMLEESLKFLGFAKDVFYFTNIVKCAHEKNFFPDKEMIDRCKDVFIAELESLKNLRRIVILGSQTKKIFDEYVKNTRFKTFEIHYIKHPAFYQRQGLSPEHYAKELRGALDGITSN